MARDESFATVPKWNEEASSPDPFIQRVKLYVMGTKKEDRYLCRPRALAPMDPAVQNDSRGDHQCTDRKTPSCVGTKRIQESIRLSRQQMEAQGLAPRNGSVHANKDSSL